MIKSTIILNKSQIEELISMNDVIKSVEAAFAQDALANVQMPAKKYIYFKDEEKKSKGDLRIMPCFINGTNAAGVKCVNVHPKNPEKHDLPTVMAVIELVDPDTGFPIAIMDGTSVTNMRTGAAAGVATKYLAREDSETCGFVGAGVQALLSFNALNEVMDIKEVRISSRTENSRNNLARFITEEYGIDAKPVESVKESVEGIDVVTTSTPARKPVVKTSWISSGTHINAIGADAPGKQELESNLLKRCKIVIDDWKQASHSGEINVPLIEGIIKKADVHSKLGDVIIEHKPGRETSKEITLFDSTGLAVQDIATAWNIYEKSLIEGIGQEINLLA